MGKKRISALVEITYDADDPRAVADLAAVTRDAVSAGVQGQRGGLAAWAVTGVAIDPDTITQSSPYDSDPVQTGTVSAAGEAE